MCSLKTTAIDRGWLKADEQLLVPRLAYPLNFDLPDVIHENNRSARDIVVREALEGIAQPRGNPSLFGDEPEVVVAETDRYGIPLRTVLGTRSGLMRSDPYYGEDYLARFYREHYRKLYRPRRFSLAWFFAEQIRSGQRIMERVEQRLPPEGTRVGCRVRHGRDADPVSLCGARRGRLRLRGGIRPARMERWIGYPHRRPGYARR